ncbi:ComEA family DNA-binding protein [Blastococcus sp. CCUG 61487]|uniref:ComEA family DNA-binding protein n=1 Tax=Blastococcus sp. CCUG 61487 TaxID=1840703 RepID=UPI0010BFAB91|nr:ComEA family DNA-binding protein [Blastococcus sp. CCUG 61487]TKJ31739.1 hypothetical protein A6V29_18080 [Blastococcus sp. CCUG 61487]
MRSSSRRSGDADVIRARLRALLDESGRGGWVPEELDVPTLDPVATPIRPEPGRARRDEPEPGAVGAALPEPDRPPGVGRHRRPGPAVRWTADRRGVRSLWAAGLLAALLLVAWTWWDRPQVVPVGPVEVPAPAGAESTGPPAPAPLVGEVAETSSTVVVAVVGLVGRPGVVTLPTGARVADAVEAAGGLLPGTDPATVNLAALVSDGQQIAVGVPGAADAPQPQASGPGVAAPGGRVNLNTATAAELDALPGIGPVLAQRIVDHRRDHGSFRSVAQLDDVPGIGPAIAAELTELVTV